MKKAIWWIEYVLRHNGAYHLRYPGIDVPLYKYLMFDIIVAILAVIIVVSYAFVMSISIIINLKRFLHKSKIE